MSLAPRLRRAPGRIAAGSFILNSGLEKLRADDATAAAVHGMAVGAYPFLGRLEPKLFTRALAVAEVTVGGALLLPIVPAAVAGAGLAGFSGGLLGLYWRTPRMHPAGDLRPTPQGIPLAKDMWMAGIAAGLLIDAVLPDEQPRRVARRAERRARRAEARAASADDALSSRREHLGSPTPGMRQRVGVAGARAGALADVVEARAARGARDAARRGQGAAKTAHAKLDDARSAVSSAPDAAVGAALAGIDAAKSAAARARDAVA
jgi:hypothetical protein